MKGKRNTAKGDQIPFLVAIVDCDLCVKGRWCHCHGGAFKFRCRQERTRSRSHGKKNRFASGDSDSARHRQSVLVSIGPPINTSTWARRGGRLGGREPRYV